MKVKKSLCMKERFCIKEQNNKRTKTHYVSVRGLFFRWALLILHVCCTGKMFYFSYISILINRIYSFLWEIECRRGESNIFVIQQFLDPPLVGVEQQVEGWLLQNRSIDIYQIYHISKYHVSLHRRQDQIPPEVHRMI